MSPNPTSFPISLIHTLYFTQNFMASFSKCLSGSQKNIFHKRNFEGIKKTFFFSSSLNDDYSLYIAWVGEKYILLPKRIDRHFLKCYKDTFWTWDCIHIVTAEFIITHFMHFVSEIYKVNIVGIVHLGNAIGADMEGLNHLYNLR